MEPPKIVEFRKEHDCENIAKTLRNIADDIEKGEYDFEPTLAVLVVATESQKRLSEDLLVSYQWSTHGIGKATYFSTKGLLACAISRFTNKDE